MPPHCPAEVGGRVVHADGHGVEVVDGVEGHRREVDDVSGICNDLLEVHLRRHRLTEDVKPRNEDQVQAVAIDLHVCGVLRIHEEPLLPPGHLGHERVSDVDVHLRVRAFCVGREKDGKVGFRHVRLRHAAKPAVVLLHLLRGHRPAVVHAVLREGPCVGRRFRGIGPRLLDQNAILLHGHELGRGVVVLVLENANLLSTHLIRKGLLHGLFSVHEASQVEAELSSGASAKHDRLLPHVLRLELLRLHEALDLRDAPVGLPRGRRLPSAIVGVAQLRRHP
mmetsp:Transcript_54084/g.153226  ORF Transcript_54084/g.153226 Transcript_54084/m.153226 type:complete len:280 (-) Transcript_54084:118-957(-)